MMANTQLKFLVFCVCILFSPITKGVHGQCSTPPINQAVYAGTQNAMMTCNSPTKVSWILKPTSDELSSYKITNYDDIVTTGYTNLFGVNSTGLIIKKAQTTPVTPPISTSGLYVISIKNSTTKYGAKLLVVRQAPNCTCKAFNATHIQLNVSILYADGTNHPIDAKMNWTSNGNFFKSETPARAKLNGKEHTSSSVIIVNGYDPPNYQCTVTFAMPRDSVFPYVATNAPAFSASCTLPFCGSTATTSPPTTTTTTPSTRECYYDQNATYPKLEQNCTKASECHSDGTNLTEVYNERVVKAELYAKSDICCSEALVCGVVVTIRNDSRWFIHDSCCYDNKCEMDVVDASCMSSDWKLLTERKVNISGVGDYVQAGNNVHIGANVTDCSESCKRMMNLP